MSIINEALKKAQKDLKRKDVPVSIETSVWPQPPAPQPAATAPLSIAPSVPPQKAWNTIVVWEVIALGVIGTVLFFLQPQIFNTFSKEAAPVQAAPSVGPTPVPLAPATSVIRRPKPAQNAMTLNGIMKIENKWMALINDEIYEEGDYIKNKKVEKISSEGVTLLDGKRTIFLSARHKKNQN